MNPEDVSNWVYLHNKKKYEERPYRECENCSRNKLRWTKRIAFGIPFIGTSKAILQEYCSNCKYSSDIIKREVE